MRVNIPGDAVEDVLNEPSSSTVPVIAAVDPANVISIACCRRIGTCFQLPVSPADVLSVPRFNTPNPE